MANWLSTLIPTITALGGVLTIIILIFRVVTGVERRLSKLETQGEMMWNLFQNHIIPQLFNSQSPGNPMIQERWELLIKKLSADSLTDDEAKELQSAFRQKRKEAGESEDRGLDALLLIGLAMLAEQLGEPYDKPPPRRRR